MKRTHLLLALVIAAASLPASLLAGPVGSDCTLNGKRLYGKVQIVDSFPDFKVEVVSSFPDLKVERVSSFADSCGKWQIVDSFPDFKVQIVSSFGDFKIQYVNSFPGVN